MSLTTLAHRKWATVTVTTSTCPGLLDHIYTAITQANDYAGVAIPSALTVTKYQNAGTTEAIYGTFGAGSALTPKFLIAGVNAARTPLMSSSTNGSHTWTANHLMAGLTKNAGAFASWDHASQPFTSGSPIGLSKFYDASVAAAKIHALVTAETLWVFVETATGTMFGAWIGAILDPETTTSTSAESDGRLYSVGVTGTTSIATNAHNAGSGIFYHGASNNAAHFLTLKAGTSSCLRTSRLSSQSASTTTTLTNWDSEPVALPLYAYDTVGDRFLGRLREVCVVRDAKMTQRQSPAGTDRWFYVGSSASVDGDCFGLMA
jgi:hypothetical protein